MKAVETKQLTVSYGGIDVLSDISVSADCGDYIGLVGPNGSGKTTLVRAILGLIDVQRGERCLFGQKIAAFRDWPRIGYLPQKGLFLDPRFPATVSEVLASGILSRRKFPRILSAADAREIRDVLGLLKIEDLVDRPIGRLSGGQQQRVLLARALAHRPDLLVLDEPTVALDPQTRAAFYSVLEHLNREHKTTIVLVSHDINTIGQYASKLLYLDRKVVFYGKFDEFCHSDDMRDYFGNATQHVICHRH